MPGLAGLVSSNKDLPAQGKESMLEALRYGRATTMESYKEDNIGLGCVHHGTGGCRALYQSNQVVVVFFGYLTQPSFPPGADFSAPDAAARYIHDQYLKQDESMMQEMAGAFAIAIWDKRTENLLLITDYLGLRPIYYSEHNGIFRFASEVKGILSDPFFPHRINKAAFADFFYFGHILQEKTFFEDIQLIPPASILRYHDAHTSITSYWDINFPDTYPHRADNWYDDLINQAIHSSVKKMIRPGLKYGLSLSGGMDSRWIAAYLSKYQPNSIAFTLGTPGSDDTPIAEEVARQTGLSHHYLELSTSYIAEMGETYTYLVDGMDSWGSMDEFPLSVRIGDYVDVAVGGLLGGPTFGYYIDPVSANLRKEDVKKYFLWRNRGERLSQHFMDRVFGPERGGEFRIMAMDSLNKCIESAPCKHGFQVYQYITLKYNQNRSSNLAQIAKLAFVDTYHPLADKDVVRAASQLPGSQLIVEEAYRRAMVTHFPELSKIPWTYTMTPLSISAPAAVLKKVAQHTLGQWLRKTPLGNHPLIRPRRYYTNHYQWSRGPLRSFIEETLLSPEANAASLFDPDGLRIILFDHMEGRRDVTCFIDQALAVAIWTRLFFTPSTPIRPSSLLDQKASPTGPIVQ